MGTLLIVGGTAYQPELEEDGNSKYYRGNISIDYISSGDFSQMSKEDFQSAVFKAISNLQPIKI